MQGQRRITQFHSGYSGDANIDRHGLHVQAVLRDAMPVGAKPLVAPRGSVAAHDVDFGVRSPQRDGQIMQQVEHAGIVFVHIARPVIAQKVIEFGERSEIVGVAVAIDDIELFSRVEMNEMKAVGAGRTGICCERLRGDKKQETGEE